MKYAVLAPKKNVTLPTKYRQFHRALAHWYHEYGRHHLPWRNTRDSYAIYLSEIMLQQTQVKTVLERFYSPFLKRFPTLRKLAAASEQEVLSAWQGLGYYSRARNLHQAATQCDGVLPKSIKALLALPGIGKNTAHAIAAFAYHQPVPVMETNVKRVLCRIFALQNPNDKILWEKATELLDCKNSFDYNQAMMDIGAMICTKRAPKCDQCPANMICEGKGQPEQYPLIKKKQKAPVRYKHIVVHYDKEGLICAVPRSARFLQGLYHFTEQDSVPESAHKIGSIEQSYSHFTLKAEVWLQRRGRLTTDKYTLTQLHTLPMSMAEKKILRLLALQNPPLCQ